MKGGLRAIFALGSPFGETPFDKTPSPARSVCTWLEFGRLRDSTQNLNRRKRAVALGLALVEFAGEHQRMMRW